MKGSFIQSLKKFDDVLEVVVFDWALHPQRRAKTLAFGALAGLLAFQGLAPEDLTPQESFEKGRALLAAKAKTPEAIALLEAASQGMPEDSKVWQALGHAYQNAKRDGDALEAYTKAVRYDRSVSNLFFLGYAFSRNELSEASIGTFNEILEEKPFFYPALAYQGVAHDRAGRYQEALHFYARALAYNPRYVPGYFHRGITYVNTKEYEKSIREFRRVLELDPTESAAYYNIACCFSLMGDTEKANRWLKKSVDQGFHDFAHMAQDSDLDNIRNTEAYKAQHARAQALWQAEAAK